MPAQLLNLPINVPWQLIHQSPDMMDVQFCNKRFPFEWRSSLAISVFEPKPEDLPEDLCEGVITFLKVTCTITGYEPTKEETERGYVQFPNVPTGRLDSILQDYFACYGVLLNVAVSPYPATQKQLDPVSVDFRDQHLGDVANPLQIGQVSFEAPAPNRHNNIVDITLQNGEQKRLLDLRQELAVAVPATSSIEAKVVQRAPTPITMDAYKGNQLVGSETTGPEQLQVHELKVEGEDIDRVFFRAPENEGFLAEFTHYVARDVPVDLKNFPHIIDFEPKTRDLYQSATEDGELLTASTSDVKTDKSFTHGESSETGVSGNAGISVGLASLGAGISHKWGDTSQDSSTTQIDSSRDKREKHATTTNLSQLYNLLTGYHPGTNRAVFLMLPRPHVLQPTDHRTFIQGLRYIEGPQDFFLIVARPKEITGLCIEASLETGHFPENVVIEEPPVEFDEGSEDFEVSAFANNGIFSGDTTRIADVHTVAAGSVVDRREKRKGVGPLGGGWDEGHPGIAEIANNSNDQANSSLRGYNYQPISDSAVQVSGVIEGGAGGAVGSGPAQFQRTYRVFTRSEQPKPTSTQPRVPIDRLLITNRCLCVCFNSGKCPEVVATPPCPPPPPAVAIAVAPPPISLPISIVDERIIEIDAALLTRDATGQTTYPARKEVLRKIQSAMANSGRLRTRLPFGEVGFLDTDYFKDRIRQVLPPAVLGLRLADVPNLPTAVINAFGGQATVADALEPDLGSFCGRTGLSIRDAANARSMLLTARQPSVP